MSGVALLVIAVGGASACKRESPPRPAAPTRVEVRREASLTPAADCSTCHAAETEAWRRSQHASAQRPVDGRPLPPSVSGTPAGWLGVAPLEQALVMVERGRIQVADPARDTRTGEWFSVHGANAPPPTAWGGWASRSNSWNSQCAQCHTTGFEKRYDASTDTFASRQDALGVACAACHTLPVEHAVHPVAEAVAGSRTARCEPCHAVGESLSAPSPHGSAAFRLADPNGYDQFPDGRAREELFEVATFRSSAMHGAGVDCLDCHDPHSGGLQAPLEANALCLQCHGAGEPPAGRSLTTKPPVIDVAHSHHPAGSSGASCVSCHMPARTFMGRDARRDHRFYAPDPAADAARVSPEVCTGCHTERDTTWAAATAERWWPNLVARRNGSVALALDAVAAGDPTAMERVAARFAAEKSGRERVRLLAAVAPPFAGGEALLQTALRDPSTEVRSAAIRLLGRLPAARSSLLPFRAATALDERLAALWATRRDPMTEAQAAEVEAWLSLTLDDPAGAMRAAEWYQLRGNDERALLHAKAAAAWAPSFATLRTLAAVLQANGKAAEAAEAMRQAAQRAPN
jgi:predicted CXXCH cytochrome family protein